jgi:hypothetical protein
VQVLEHEQHRRDAVGHGMDGLEDGLVQRHPVAAVVGRRLLDPSGHAVEHRMFRRHRADGGRCGTSDVVRVRQVARADDPGERLGEGEVGEAAGAEIDAVTHDDDHVPLLRPAQELGRQPGLADARVPGHEHAGGRARDRGLEEMLEASELAGPADERRVGGDQRHAKHGVTDHRQRRYRADPPARCDGPHRRDRREAGHACR